MENQFRLRHKYLASNIAKTLKALFEFIGLPFEPYMLDFLDTKYHILNGNAIRLGTGSEIRRGERWRTELGLDDLAYFDRIGGGAINRRLEYRD